MRVDTPPIEYMLSADDATWLAGVSMVSAAERKRALKVYADEFGVLGLVNLFSEFVGLANSVVENNREMIEILGWISGDTNPDGGPGPNLPTIFGACMGIRLSAGIDPEGLCHGCAFRQGTPANQSPITTTDANGCIPKGEGTFWCHDEFKEDGSPAKACPGWAKARAAA